MSKGANFWIYQNVIDRCQCKEGQEGADRNLDLLSKRLVSCIKHEGT